MTRMTARQKRLYQAFAEQMIEVREDMQMPLLARGQLPADWAGIRTTPVPGRVRITLRVDTDVAKFYRALGPGYQAVMNRVLRGFMLARLCDVLPEPDEMVVEEPGPETRHLLEQEITTRRLLEALRQARREG